MSSLMYANIAKIGANESKLEWETNLEKLL